MRSPTAAAPASPQRALSPLPRLHQLRDMHDDLTLDAELDLDLDEELRMMSFLRTPQNRIRTRSLTLLSPQYSLSPSSSPSALRNLSPPKHAPLLSHRSLPKHLSSPIPRSPAVLPPPLPALSPQRSPSPQRSASNLNSCSPHHQLSPRYSYTSQHSTSSAAGTAPHSPSGSAVHAAAAPTRMPPHAPRDADHAALQVRLSHMHLVAQPPGRFPGPTATLRSSAPTSLSAAMHRSNPLDSEGSGELVPEAAVRAPLSCQGLLRRGSSMHEAPAASVGTDACLPRSSSVGAWPPPSEQVSPQLWKQPRQAQHRPGVGAGQRELPGYESSDAEESGGESSDDCSMGTLTLTPALAAECSELVRALAAGQPQS